MAFLSTLSLVGLDLSLQGELGSNLILACSYALIIFFLITKSNKLKDRLGYTLPILFSLPIPYLIYDMNTCGGGYNPWCALGSWVVFMPLSFLAILSLIVSSIVYAIKK